jgi:hypothetical protein
MTPARFEPEIQKRERLHIRALARAATEIGKNKSVL